MHKLSQIVVSLFLFVVTFFLYSQVFAQNWPGWRGDGSGISQETGIVKEWSETKNIRWKTEIPGYRHQVEKAVNLSMFVPVCWFICPKQQEYHKNDSKKPPAA